MAWNVEVFETSRGDRVIEKFIRLLDSKTVAKLGQTIDLLEKYGPYLSMPHAKKINQTLFELRVRGKQEVRILYSYIGSKICLLHAFKKQTQKTPKKEISIALKRHFQLTPIQSGLTKT